MGLGECGEVVVERGEDGDPDEGRARLGVGEAERAGGLGLFASVVGLAEVEVEASLVGGREGEQRGVVELLRERLGSLDVSETLIDAKLELGEAEVGVGELVGEAAGAEIGREVDELFAGSSGDWQRSGSRGEESFTGGSQLGRQRACEGAQSAARADLHPDSREVGRGVAQGLVHHIGDVFEEVEGLGGAALREELLEPRGWIALRGLRAAGYRRRGRRHGGAITGARQRGKPRRRNALPRWGPVVHHPGP